MISLQSYRILCIFHSVAINHYLFGVSLLKYCNISTFPSRDSFIQDRVNGKYRGKGSYNFLHSWIIRFNQTVSFYSQVRINRFNPAWNNDKQPIEHPIKRKKITATTPPAYLLINSISMLCTFQCQNYEVVIKLRHFLVIPFLPATSRCFYTIYRMPPLF